MEANEWPGSDHIARQRSQAVVGSIANGGVQKPTARCAVAEHNRPELIVFRDAILRRKDFGRCFGQDVNRVDDQPRAAGNAVDTNADTMGIWRGSQRVVVVAVERTEDAPGYAASSAHAVVEVLADFFPVDGVDLRGDANV